MKTHDDSSFGRFFGRAFLGVAAMAAMTCLATPEANPECETCPQEANTTGFTVALVNSPIASEGKITFDYEICGNGAESGLSHWILNPYLPCLVDGVTLEDLVFSVKVIKDDIELVEGIDYQFSAGNNQGAKDCFAGLKFDLLGDLGDFIKNGGCVTFSITFDLNPENLGNKTITVGCVQVQTKAGNEDCETSPAVCIQGPVCSEEEVEIPICYTDETAWSGGTRYVSRGNWATFTDTENGEKIVTLYAGQIYEAGTVHFSAPIGGFITIEVLLNPGFIFAQDDDGNPIPENLKIQGYSPPPSGNPEPGQFTIKTTESGTSAVVMNVPAFQYYGVHADLLRVIDCPTEAVLP